MIFYRLVSTKASLSMDFACVKSVSVSHGSWELEINSKWFKYCWISSFSLQCWNIHWNIIAASFPGILSWLSRNSSEAIVLINYFLFCLFPFSSPTLFPSTTPERLALNIYKQCQPQWWWSHQRSNFSLWKPAAYTLHGYARDQIVHHIAGASSVYILRVIHWFDGVMSYWRPLQDTCSDRSCVWTSPLHVAAQGCWGNPEAQPWCHFHCRNRNGQNLDVLDATPLLTTR